MLNKRKNRQVRSLWGYLPAIIRFYGLKNEKLAAFIFLIMLSISFISNFFTYKILNGMSLTLDPQNMDQLIETSKVLFTSYGVLLVTFLLLNIVGSAYIYAFLRDIRGIPYTFIECILVTLKRLHKIIILSSITVLAIATGVVIFVVPGIIIYLMFIFSNQYLVDQNRGLFQSIKASIHITNGIKGNIFAVILLFNLLMFLFPSIVGTGSGLLVNTFVSAFIGTVFNLMYHRLVSIMYFELEYVYIVEKNEEIV